MKILAIDYGTQNVGLALSDDEGKLAFPYKTIKNQQLTKNNFLLLRDVCQLENVKKIIVGMPINLASEKTKTTGVVFKFVQKIKKELGIPVELIDERLSTEQAQKMAGRGKDLDVVAAQILLEKYLEGNRD